MFLGEARHSLDQKSRVILPAKYRDELKDGAYMAKGRGRCLSVYPAGYFEDVARRTDELAKQGDRQLQVARSFFAGATDIAPDKQGRVAIPPNLREYAGVGPGSDVIVAGAFHRIDIWAPDRWEAHQSAADEDLIGSSELAELGL